ncbi:MAG: transporter substrate-binding domain-containing protein [Thermoanaerobaculia bacterium]|nr:transporter substrate-binding domain-containing protein [Thermoanaerobaculia bacterium]
MRFTTTLLIQRTIVSTLLILTAVSSAVGAEEFVVAIRNPAGVFVQPSEQGLSGFDIDLLNQFVSWHENRFHEKLTVAIKEVENIDQLLDMAEGENCDIAVGSITITEARAQRVDFSDSYLPVRMVLFAKKDRIAEGPYQTTLKGKILGGLEGSTAIPRIADLQKEVGQIESRAYPDYDSLFAALLGPNPEIDGVVTDVTHYWVLSAKESLTLVAPMSEEQGLGFVIPKGSPWTAKLNAFLDELSHTPGYFQLVRRYFGKEAADMLMFSKAGES